MADVLDVAADADLGPALPLLRSGVYWSVGNPKAADITELTGTVSWGAKDATSESASRAITIRHTLRHATWSHVSFDIDSITPTSIGFLRFADAVYLGVALCR